MTRGGIIPRGGIFPHTLDRVFASYLPGRSEISQQEKVSWDLISKNLDVNSPIYEKSNEECPNKYHFKVVESIGEKIVLHFPILSV
jgi:hypothetical protein